MRRVNIEILKENTSLTVGELLQKLEAEEQTNKQKDEVDFNLIKSEFTNVYLKRVVKNSFFGRTLDVYHIKNITNRERTTDWDFIYHTDGYKFNFSKRNINFSSICNDSFSENELRTMTIITKEEYNFYITKYNYFTDELGKLIK